MVVVTGSEYDEVLTVVDDDVYSLALFLLCSTGTASTCAVAAWSFRLRVSGGVVGGCRGPFAAMTNGVEGGGGEVGRSRCGGDGRID